MVIETIHQLYESASQNISQAFESNEDRLERALDTSIDYFNTDRGRDTLVKAILYQEEPLYPSEYAFRIKDGSAQSATRMRSRTEDLTNVIESILTSDGDEPIKHLLSLSETATIELEGDIPHFHTHPCLTERGYDDPDRSTFSKEDLRIARSVPFGLIQYTQRDEDPLTLEIEVSMIYKNKIHGCFPMFLTLHDEGVYTARFDDETTGEVPTIGYFNNEIYKFLMGNHTLETNSITHYARKHAFATDTSEMEE